MTGETVRGDHGSNPLRFMPMTRTHGAADSSTWPGLCSEQRKLRGSGKSLAGNHSPSDYFPNIQQVAQTNGFSRNFTSGTKT